MPQSLKIVIIKPSKYMPDGSVERFRRGFMPNSTILHMQSMLPSEIDNHDLSVTSIDEYVHTDLEYLRLLSPSKSDKTLLLLVGVQSHQFHRALDLAALAFANGCMVVIGGPHIMTCDTTMIWKKGASFVQCEAELVMNEILTDAVSGELKPVYGMGLRWQEELESPVLTPPTRSELNRYIIPMMGIYPARGCPFICSFCSVTKIAGRRIRSQSLATTMESLKRAKAAGVKTIMFTSDNFNKYSQAEDLLEMMIDEKLKLKFFVQCDTQVFRQEKLVELLARAGCYQMFVGVESFRRETLIAANKKQNRPDAYHHIVKLCHEHGIGSHFSNIIGFPEDTEESIREHLSTLQEINPNWASFYILCPIPGTEQYDTFLNAGLITENNLDRFDTTSLTWKHPNLSEHRLIELLYECYRRFSTMGHAIENVWDVTTRNGRGSARERAGSLAMSAFVRFCAWRRTHPMSGGIMRVKIDSARDLAFLRRKAYGFDLAPLPGSLNADPFEAMPDELPPAIPRLSMTDTRETFSLTK